MRGSKRRGRSRTWSEPLPLRARRAESRALDNLCHTLAGAALGEAGLKRRTPLATATLLIGANLPDVDAFVYAFGDNTTALAFRRGWTHGILAMAILPAALAALMAVGDRYLRRRARPPEHRARFGALLFLAYVSVLSHPLLDFLNTYGMRFLAPFSWRWVYGDALFIIDPWIWIAFALGVAFSRSRARRGRPRPETPARIALGAVAVYALAMVVSSLVGRGIVAREAARSGLSAPRRVMISPVPLDPFRRFALVEDADGYRFGSLLWKPRASAAVSADLIPKNDADPASVAASRTTEGRKYLVWARFPFYEVRRGDASATVTIRDARYSARDGSWSTVTIVVTEPVLRSPP